MNANVPIRRRSRAEVLAYAEGFDAGATFALDRIDGGGNMESARKWVDLTLAAIVGTVPDEESRASGTMAP